MDIYENSSLNSFGIDSYLTFVNTSAIPDTNETDIPYKPYDQRLETYLVPAIFALIFIVGVIGNGTLIFIFFRHRAMRNVPNTWVIRQYK